MGTLTTTLALPGRTITNARVGPISIPVIATLAMLIGSSVLLFARLGHYSLWTDEASTAITAVGVWRTGDTSAWLNDHNLLTYRDGLLLKHQKDRYTSPLQFYLAAPFIGLLGQNSLACRLPFAICGLGTVIVILLWLRRAQPPNEVWIASAVILLTTASFFLFQRQCRYFAPATFLSTSVAYLYCHWNGTRRQLLGIAAVMSLLLTAQYLDYAAVVACLLMDYGLWGRRRRAIRGIEWLILILPQLLTAAVVCPIWNPIERAASAVAPAVSAAHASVTTTQEPWFHGFATLYWWNLRDLLACDFAILPLLLLCPILYLWRKDARLLRAPMALLIFVAAIACFTAHPLVPGGNAEVRYLAPLLPLCIGIGILAVWGMQSLPRWSRAAMLGLSAVSILYHSSALSYYRELLHPTIEPYTPVAQWIYHNIPAHSTVYVCPDLAVSPMMWAAPQPTYVWQLSDPPKPDYTALPPIYFKGRIPPDYLIAFGPYLAEIKDWQTRFAAQGVRYEPAATIPVYSKEMFRPELIWRSFTTIDPRPGEMVYIFRRATQI